MIGPTFYGNASNRKVNSVNETTVTYLAGSIGQEELKDADVSVFPNPSSDLVAIQCNGLVRNDIEIELIDKKGRIIQSKRITKGSTIAYFDLQSVYQGSYLLRLTSKNNQIMKKIQIIK